MTNTKIHQLHNGKIEAPIEVNFRNSDGSYSEEMLQKLLFDNPILLKEGVFPLAREFETGDGPADLILVDKEGNFYVVETKLVYNPDRRKIIGQIFDYGSSILQTCNAEKEVKDKVNDKWFEKFFQKLDLSVKKYWSVGFENKIKDYFGFSKEEYDKFYEYFKENLIHNKITYFIVMDEIEERLLNNMRLLYEYSTHKLNITLFELKKFISKEKKEYYSSKFYEFIREPEYSKSGSKRSKWDQERFFEAIDKKFEHPGDRKIIKELIQWAMVKENFDSVAYGTGSVEGSFNPKLSNFSQRSVFTLYTDGRLVLNFDWLNDNDEIKRKTKVLEERLQKIFPQVPLIDQKYPRIEFELWKNKLDDFKKIISGVLGTK